MHDLTLVGVHDDGEHVVLASTDGQRFKLLVDESLRAAVRRDRPRLGQLQIEMDGRLRPRDIQARIRAGQSAAEVADAAGLPIEHVRRFEGPVLAERDHMAREARNVTLRRGPAPPSPTMSSPTLAELVAERLARREADPDAATWDSWRTEDGPWTVHLRFAAGGRERNARWAFDPNLRHVTPLDDESRWLTEPERDDEGLLPHRRLAPVRETTIDVTGPYPEVEEQVEAASEPVAEPDDAAPTTVDLLDSLRARRGRRTRPVSPEDEDALGSDPLEDLLGSLLARDEVLSGSSVQPGQETLRDPGPNHPARRAASRPSNTSGTPNPTPNPGMSSLLATDPFAADPSSPPLVVHLPEDPKLPARGVAAAADPTAGSAVPGSPAGSAASAGPAPTPTPAPSTAPIADRPPARKSRRASVPSWDDIVFGARRE